MRRLLKPLIVASASLMLAVPVSAQDASDTPFDHASYRYRCAGGTSIDVAYINLDSGLSLAVLHYDGRMLVLENVESASGARYATPDERAGEGTRHVWWANDREGFLQEGPDGDEAFLERACTG